MNPVTTLAGLLGVSLIISAGLGMRYLVQRDKATQAVEQRDAARSASSACSDATEALRELADKRKLDAAGARATAAGKALALDKRADATLAQQPSEPANSCASIQALGDDWLKERSGK